VALGALIVCVIGLVLCRLNEDIWPWLAWPRAFFEAGTVGALADWFAVVALFRHPLGIPIPHTAILPKNQHRAGKAIASFLEGGFLTEKRLREVLLPVDYSRWVANWITEHADQIATTATAQTPQLLDFLQRRRTVVAEAARTGLAALDPSPLVATVAGFLFEGGRDTVLISGIFRATNTFLHDQEEVIRDRIREEIPISADMLRSIPVLKNLAGPLLEQVRDAIALAVATRTIQKVENLLQEATRQPTHPLRLSVETKLKETLKSLEGSGELAQRLRKAQLELARGETLDDLVEAVLKTLGAALLEDCQSTESRTREALRSLLVGVSEEIAKDENLRATLNQYVGQQMVHCALEARPKVREFVETTVSSWQAEEMASRLEAILGRDLQFIRLNGTVIGGLIGVFIHAVFAVIK